MNGVNRQETMQKLPRMLTRKDLQELLQVSRKTLARLIATGAIPTPVKVGTRDRWTQKDYIRILRS
jgi:predicted DNA-binding transcriptional regulator AlpA